MVFLWSCVRTQHTGRYCMGSKWSLYFNPKGLSSYLNLARIWAQSPFPWDLQWTTTAWHGIIVTEKQYYFKQTPEVQIVVSWNMIQCNLVGGFRVSKEHVPSIFVAEVWKSCYSEMSVSITRLNCVITVKTTFWTITAVKTLNSASQKPKITIRHIYLRTFNRLICFIQ